jgi:hypothetical protein
MNVSEEWKKDSQVDYKNLESIGQKITEISHLHQKYSELLKIYSIRFSIKQKKANELEAWLYQYYNRRL